ncbi:hypothetical protein JTB14_007830 [Gonioctena quinquepunctata]|nr:hypothetical protein JTB14_007830 [Gonioctena quinquepunctata]
MKKSFWRFFKGDNKKKAMGGMLGAQYEQKILGLISLQSLLDENIEDFWVISNPDEIPKFDDVILWVKYKSEEEELFMIQLKHKKKKYKNRSRPGK